MLNRIHLVAAGVAMMGAAVWTDGAQAAVTPVRSLEGFYNADPEYVEQTGNLRFKDGFGVRRNTYVNGRLTAMYGDLTGLFGVRYYGPNTAENSVCGVGETETCAHNLEVTVSIDGKYYRLEFHDTEHFPFGFRSHCEVGGVKLMHELVLDDNVVFRRVKVESNPLGKPVKVRLSQSQTMRGGGTLSKFLPDKAHNRVVATRDEKSSYKKTDPATGKTKYAFENLHTEYAIGLAEDCTWPINWFNKYGEGQIPPRPDPRNVHIGRFLLIGKEPGDEHIAYLAINPKADEDLSGARIDRVYRRFADFREKTFRVRTGDEVVDSCLESVPAMFAFNEFPDCPGAFRAGFYYYVWAWDSMVHADVFALSGHPELLKRLLDFFGARAGETGIPFSFNRQLEGRVGKSRYPEQDSFYTVLLSSYLKLTGDESVRTKYLPIARGIVNRCMEKRRPGENMLRPNKGYPDRPEYMLMTTNDFMTCENVLYYQGLKAWEELTGEDPGDAAKVLHDINTLLWDEKRGFWTDSRDGLTGELRPFYPGHSIFYISPWALDMVREKGLVKEMAKYYRDHFFAGYGVRTADMDDERTYMVDGCHIGSHRPVVLRNYWNLMNEAGDWTALADFRRILSMHWRTLTYPEGMLVETENYDVRVTNDNPGAKQIFGAKAWLWDVIELNLGFRALKDGFTLHAMGDGVPFELRGFTLRGKTIDFRITGRGATASYVFNGKPLTKPFVAYADLRDRNTVDVLCK